MYKRQQYAFPHAGHEKNPPQTLFAGDSNLKKLSLGELRRATGGLEAVFLTFLHSRVTGQQARFLQNGTEVLGVVLQQRARNTVADGAGLTGDAAAAYTACLLYTSILKFSELFTHIVLRFKRKNNLKST